MKYYVATTTLTPLDVEDGWYERIGSSYALISRKQRFKVTLENSDAVKTLEVAGTPVEELNNWLWEMRTNLLVKEVEAIEKAEEKEAQKNEVDKELVELIKRKTLAELKKNGYAEISADSKEAVVAAIELYESLIDPRCEAKYYSIAAKYVFTCDATRPLRALRPQQPHPLVF